MNEREANKRAIKWLDDVITFAKENTPEDKGKYQVFVTALVNGMITACDVLDGLTVEQALEQRAIFNEWMTEHYQQLNQKELT